MEIVIIKRDSIEWIDMWERLANHPLNEGLEEPTVAGYQGEAWQYLNSYKKGNKVIHELRHRHHPTTKDLAKIVIYASDNFSEDQIDRIIKVK